ncbi:hypothetical protein JG688_00006435 [Phytophthora aleatoria]|uniref:Uncharacterized protein n=1 Tax=Phytophthora aleatoria TaxID=2496075 RepID=A0A8J5J781_9STRA|nr:hypothetical protein JG688_00006435 [Phytophthora aleatoria]
MLLSPLFLFEPFKFTIGTIASRVSSLLRANQSAFREYRELLVSADTGAVRSLQQFDSQWQDYYRAKRSSDDDKEPEDAALLRTKAPATSSMAPDNTCQADENTSTMKLFLTIFFLSQQLSHHLRA